MALEKSEKSFHEIKNQVNSKLARLGILLAKTQQIWKSEIPKAVRKIALKIGVAFEGHRISWLRKS